MHAQVSDFVGQYACTVSNPKRVRWFHVLQGRKYRGRSLGMFYIFTIFIFGDSRPLGTDGLHEEEGFKYILVMIDDRSNFV